MKKSNVFQYANMRILDGMKLESENKMFGDYDYLTKGDKFFHILEINSIFVRI